MLSVHNYRLFNVIIVLFRKNVHIVKLENVNKTYIRLLLGDNCILIEGSSTSIVDLMIANRDYY